MNVTCYMCVTCVYIERASSDFDGDFSPEFGTEHPPANYCARYAMLHTCYTDDFVYMTYMLHVTRHTVTVTVTCTICTMVEG